MNSYPPELLAQLAPVMFVAGLDVPAPPPAGTTATPPKDPFVILAIRLREALISQRKVAIWQPDRSKTFQVVLVDKEVRFPPRKLAPPEDQPFITTHSPLSPLTPTSPLHPDGLIAPIWIRKHTTLVPSVFVLFKRIYESPPLPKSSSSGDFEAEKEREAEERKRDTELAAEIALRKRSTNERAIKLTAVLMASRKMLDDPALDARLTYIRRQSGLDPRAALFVLSPVTQSEIGDFVRSLQEALYDPAIEYYTNHSKRVRRKRNRHSQVSAAYNIPAAPGSSGRPLRPEGWTVRYEYKMACFAEFRGEVEVALKHYQDAYTAILVMFGSTAILPPRTKRWAEAKVLSDCVNLKICKLYLYNNEHSLALAHHSTHMRKFSDLSRGWGIGDETFEYWSWLARQHRVFAELLEQGTRTTLKIPTHLPVASSTSSSLATLASEVRTGLEIDSMKSLGLNPTQALQHPGFYYYMAARCTENRRTRYLQILESEDSLRVAASSPGFANERKVDHLTIILELYTRAYELFKKYGHPSAQNQGRLTLWIAYRIAQTYFQSGKFDMAVRFFERIAKTYRRERWDIMLNPLLTTWFACARQMGDMEMSVQLLLEMLGHGSLVDQDDPDAIQEDLMAVLKTSVPKDKDKPLVVDLTESGPILDSSLVFWNSEVTVGESAAFQLTLKSPPPISLSNLTFTELSIHFSGHIPPVTVLHSDMATLDEIPLVQKIDLGNIVSDADVPLDEVEPKVVDANLRWRAGSSIVFAGSMTSDFTTIMTVSKMVLTLKQGSWCVELPIQPHYRRPGTLQIPRWLGSLNPLNYLPIRRSHFSSVAVHYRPHRISVDLQHQGPAYLGEEFPITINVVNGDERDMEIFVDILLQPTEIERAVNYINLDGEQSSSLIKGVPFGLLASGASTSKVLILGTSGAAGDRVIDISVQSRSASTRPRPTTGDSPPPTPNTLTTNADTGETLKTLTIPSIEPVTFSSQVAYKRSSRPSAGLADLATYEDDFWDDADGGEAHVVATVSCVGPTGIVIESVKLIRQDGTHAKVIDSVLDENEDDFLEEWLPGDQFCDRCRVSLSLGDNYDDGAFIPGPGVYEISWKRIRGSGEYGSLATSRFTLPPLKPPIDGLIALLDVPNTAKLHTPISIRMTVRNRHPTRSANIVIQLEPEATDGFVVAGLRNGRLPILLPGSEGSLTWNLIPVECGFVKIPKVKVINRRVVIDAQAHSGATQGFEDDAELVEVVDVRWDRRFQEAAVVAEAGADIIDAGKAKLDGRRFVTSASILVLP